MKRAIPGPTFLLLALATTALAGCGTNTSALARRAGPPLAEPWNAEIPARFRNTRVAMGSGCVLIFGRTAIDVDEPQRLVRCLDPATGEARWSRVIDVPRGLLQDKLHATPYAAIYQSGDRALGFHPRTGATLWSFDPGGRTINQAFAHGDRLYLSTDRETLVTLDARTGVWVAGHGWEGHTMLAVVPGTFGPLSVVRTANSDQGIVALDLTSAGARTPAPPFATPKVAWTLDADEGVVFQAVGGNLVSITDREIWVVSAATGETLHRAQRDGAPAPKRVTPTGLGMRSFPEVEGATADVPTDELAIRRPTLPRKNVFVGPTTIVSVAFRTGVVLEMVEIDHWNTATFERTWRSTRPARGRITAIEEAPGLGALLVASPKQVALLDLETGRTLLERRIDPLRSGWTGVATDGRGLYVLYGNDPAPRLEALPMATTTPDP